MFAYLYVTAICTYADIIKYTKYGHKFNPIIIQIHQIQRILNLPPFF